MNLIPFSRFVVHGNSMLPTLKPGSDIICFNWVYLFSKPKVGDIVIIKMNSRDMVKRIEKIHDNEFFVVGDNKNESTDSRDFGWIKKTAIIGRMIGI